MSRKHDPFIDYAMYSSIQSDREHGRPLGCGWCMLLFGGLTILYRGQLIFERIHLWPRITCLSSVCICPKLDTPFLMESV